MRGDSWREAVATGAGLPLRGRARGVVTLIQEERFRVEGERGQGYLFTLGRRAGVTVQDLYRWSGEKTPVVVEFEGPPDLGAVAVRVRPA